MFTPILGDMIQFDYVYFSSGLKPAATTLTCKKKSFSSEVAVSTWPSLNATVLTVPWRHFVGVNIAIFFNERRVATSFFSMDVVTLGKISTYHQTKIHLLTVFGESLIIRRFQKQQLFMCVFFFKDVLIQPTKPI